MDQFQINSEEEQNTYQPSAELPKPEPSFAKATDGKHKLDRQQKISLAVIAVIGVGVLIFGFWHLKNGVSIPFPDFDKMDTNQEEVVVDTRDETLRTQDSDEDGLNDYDEKYVYNTSAYLQDTDSDGYSDKQEVESGYDPTCPAGQNCFSDEFIEGQDQSTGAASTGTEYMSAEDLRATLLETGEVDQETLNQVDDETLMQLYSQTMDSEGPDAADYTDPENLSVDQIRELLVESGLSEEEVNMLDDETLLDMYQQALDEVREMQSD